MWISLSELLSDVYKQLTSSNIIISPSQSPIVSWFLLCFVLPRGDRHSPQLAHQLQCSIISFSMPQSRHSLVLNSNSMPTCAYLFQATRLCLLGIYNNWKHEVISMPQRVWREYITRPRYEDPSLGRGYRGVCKMLERWPELKCWG